MAATLGIMLRYSSVLGWVAQPFDRQSASSPAYWLQQLSTVVIAEQLVANGLRPTTELLRDKMNWRAWLTLAFPVLVLDCNGQLGFVVRVDGTGHHLVAGVVDRRRHFTHRPHHRLSPGDG